MTEPTQSSYLRYLPAIFQIDDLESPQSGNVLGKFLLPFEQTLAEFDNLLAGIDHYVDPCNAPQSFLPWLASWVALELDDTWSEEKQRRQIAEAIDLHRLRGTVQGLKHGLGLYDEDLEPTVVEHAMPGAMQIGVSSRIGGLEQKYLFGVWDETVGSSVAGLDKCELTENLRMQFKCHDIALDAPGVSVRKAKKSWAIVDLATNTTYVIRYKDGALGVFAERTHIMQAETISVQQMRRVKPVEYDYYIVESQAPSNRSSLQAQQENPGLDDPAAVYYRTDGVEWIRKGQSEEQQNYVWLKLTSGEMRFHEPATIRRLHAVTDVRYKLMVDGETVEFAGDTLMVDQIEDPFQFIVDIGIPVGWLFLPEFSLDLFEAQRPIREEALVARLRDLLKDDKIDQSKIETVEVGRRWNVTTKDGLRSVERNGWTLHLDGKPDEDPRVMLDVQDIDFEAVASDLGQKLDARGIVFPSGLRLEWEPESHRWLKIGDIDRSPAYLAIRRGTRLFFYRYVGDGQRPDVTETGGSTEGSDTPEVDQAAPIGATDGEESKDYPLKALAATHSRAIHSIVDDLKPSHTQVTLRFGLRPGPEQLAPLPIEERLIARLRPMEMPEGNSPVAVPRDLKHQLAKHHIRLSAGATLSKERDNRWRIDDCDAHRLYLRLTAQILEVFQRSSIDESMVIG